MGAYKVKPEIFEAVSKKLTSEIKCENEEMKQSRSECAERISKYQATFKDEKKFIGSLNEEVRRQGTRQSLGADKSQASFGA